MKKLISIIVGLLLLGMVGVSYAGAPKCEAWEEVQALVKEKGTEVQPGLIAVELEYRLPEDVVDGQILVTRGLLAGKGKEGEGQAMLAVSMETGERIYANAIYYFYTQDATLSLDFVFQIVSPVSEEQACKFAEEWLILYKKYAKD